MSGVSWPMHLPLPTIEGYVVSPQDAILRTDMDTGPARQRRRFRQTPSRVSVHWVFDEFQFATFEAWYKYKADEGGQWFVIDLRGGLGLLPHEARFTRQFEARLIHASLWDVTSELEIRDRPTLSSDALDLVLNIGAQNVVSLSEQMHTFVHTQITDSLSLHSLEH